MNKYSKEFYNELYNEFNNSNLNVNDDLEIRKLLPYSEDLPKNFKKSTE